MPNKSAGEYKMSTKLFGVDTRESVIDIVRRTMEVTIKEVERDGGEKTEEACLVFATNRGKGTGSQVIPLSELPDYVATLQNFRDNGFGEAAVEGYRPAAEVARETMTLGFETNEEGDQVGELGLGQLRALAGRGGFFGVGGVFLSDLIHLGDGLGDLIDALGLFLTGG
jgi:hypothetical protein